MRFALLVFILSSALLAIQPDRCFKIVSPPGQGNASEWVFLKISQQTPELYQGYTDVRFENSSLIVMKSHFKLKLISRARGLNENEDKYQFVENPSQMIIFNGKIPDFTNPYSDSGIIHIQGGNALYQRVPCADFCLK